MVTLESDTWCKKCQKKMILVWSKDYKTSDNFYAEFWKCETCNNTLRFSSSTFTPEEIKQLEEVRVKRTEARLSKCL